VAWLLVAGGAAVALVGLLLLTRFGLWHLRGELMKDLAGWGSMDIARLDPAELRRSLNDLWKENPGLAAQADEHLRSFEEIKRSDPKSLGNVQLFVRFMYVARYAAMAMVLLGVGAVAAGVWLRG
jgi:hypothetical protein